MFFHHSWWFLFLTTRTHTKIIYLIHFLEFTEIRSNHIIFLTSQTYSMIKRRKNLLIPLTCLNTNLLPLKIIIIRTEILRSLIIYWTMFILNKYMPILLFHNPSISFLWNFFIIRFIQILWEFSYFSIKTLLNWRCWGVSILIWTPLQHPWRLLTLSTLFRSIKGFLSMDLLLQIS